MITNSRATRIARRVRRTWAELEYAQRRMFELQTGVPARGPRRSTARIEELERVYRLRSA